jgi:cytochrome c oxidase assembly protein subunit 15
MVGGATRLIESGLSIVNWKPVTGVLPPIGEATWQRIVSPRESPSAR